MTFSWCPSLELIVLPISHAVGSAMVLIRCIQCNKENRFWFPSPGAPVHHLVSTTLTIQGNRGSFKTLTLYSLVSLIMLEIGVSDLAFSFIFIWIWVDALILWSVCGGTWKNEGVWNSGQNVMYERRIIFKKNSENEYSIYNIKKLAKNKMSFPILS